MKRIISASSTELQSACRGGVEKRSELRQAILGSEGRVLAAESICQTQPLVDGITNAELAAANGADLLISNLYDVNNPKIVGLPTENTDSLLKELGKLTGRVVGINLEPVPDELLETLKQDKTTPWAMSAGRVATIENARKAYSQGAQFIILTGNPGTGVTNAELVRRVGEIRAALGEEILLIAGRMHAAGVDSQGGAMITSPQVIKELAEAGADVILFPAPGSVPGVTLDLVSSWVSCAHAEGVLAMSAVGTSQEGADVDTIREIALMSKQSGVDIHHLGDCGYLGVSLPENISTYSIAIRGRRHHYYRVASSVLR
ncbi:hypothetical protein KRX54_06235 [Actinomycetaceae bacterium TAE3-ERU4]|nr:hypothetical protein [Actinomycetaceae bacterium TAE3-ERU4]